MSDARIPQGPVVPAAGQDPPYGCVVTGDGTMPQGFGDNGFRKRFGIP